AFDSGVAAGAGDAHGDLAAVGDQNLLECVHRPCSLRRGRDRGTSAAPTVPGAEPGYALTASPRRLLHSAVRVGRDSVSLPSPTSSGQDRHQSGYLLIADVTAHDAKPCLGPPYHAVAHGRSPSVEVIPVLTAAGFRACVLAGQRVLWRASPALRPTLSWSQRGRSRRQPDLVPLRSRDASVRSCTP